MGNAVNLSHIYALRKDFVIIGLTGRTGCGTSEVAKQLVEGFNNGNNFEDPLKIGMKDNMAGFKHNSYRKYRIIYNYAKINFLPFTLIKYRDVLTLLILKFGFQKFLEFLGSTELQEAFSRSKYKVVTDFSKEQKEIMGMKPFFDDLSNKVINLQLDGVKNRGNYSEVFEFYSSAEFQKFTTQLHEVLQQNSLVKRNKTLQIVSNNLRRSGDPYDMKNISAEKIFTIVELINHIVKGDRKQKQIGITIKGPTHVVIDSLRNPLEIMFFKQRYAAYYTVAVNRDDDERVNSIVGRFTLDETDDMHRLFKEEYKGGEDEEFYKQKVSACIQQADIHIAFIDKNEAATKNKRLETNTVKTDKGEEFQIETRDRTSPYFSWRMQLVKYISLIGQPGLITPSPEERCMQLAYTAKHNSGCISRHVGAAITDEFYSVKAIGWNNTPEGQVPCVLRNSEDLLTFQYDMDAFTSFEIKDPEFRDELVKQFETQIITNKANLAGRNVCHCFKALKNSCSEGKNQVHTRSLHAEESAFLQITKYGGVGIRNGKLFTTASPCELCAKKAYQLGIKVIYYIDPYPGISREHILETGSEPIEIRLFNGAIGNAYHWLYDPMMAYKDEMSLLLGHEIKDLTSKYKDQLSKKQEEIDALNFQIAELKNQSAATQN